jgi:hypothetical protein
VALRFHRLEEFMIVEVTGLSPCSTPAQERRGYRSARSMAVTGLDGSALGAGTRRNHGLCQPTRAFITQEDVAGTPAVYTDSDRLSIVRHLVWFPEPSGDQHVNRRQPRRPWRNHAACLALVSLPQYSATDTGFPCCRSL